MATAAQGQFNTISNQANTVYGQMQGQLNALQPSFQNSFNALGGLYNGQNLQQQLGFQAPIYNANNQFAQTQGAGLRGVAQANSNAIGTSLQATLAQMNAQNNGQGFLGSSTFNNNRMLQSTIGANQQAAVGQASANAQANNLTSQANLQNLSTTGGLQMADLAQRANPNALASGLGAYGQALSSPLQALSSNYQAAQAPLNFFRIAPQAWQAQNMPTVYPQINGSQIAGGAISALGTAANQYSQQQQQQAFMNQLLGSNNMNSMNNSVNQISPMFSPQSPYAATGDQSMFNMNTSLLGGTSFGAVDPYSGVSADSSAAEGLFGA